MTEKITITRLRDTLADIVGPNNVSDQDFQCWCMARDFSPEPPKMPDLVVMPKTTEQVSRIVRLANETKTPLWPRAAGTGLDICGMPLERGGIVVNMMEMNEILEINERHMTATVQPGVILRTLEEACRKKGLHPKLLGSWGTGLSATVIGGFTSGATGAGSQQYGSYCEQLVCLEAVLPNGDIIRTGSDSNPASGKIERYVNGPDLAGLFCGSHGIFGIVTEATIRLMPQPEAVDFATPAFPTYEAHAEAMMKMGNDEISYTYLSLLGKHSVQWIFGPQVEEESLMTVMIQGKKKEVEYKKELMEKVIKEGGGHDLGGDITKKYVYEQDLHWIIPTAGRVNRWLSSCNIMPIYKVPEFARMATHFFHEEKREITKKFNFPGPYFFPTGVGAGRATFPHLLFYCEEDPREWEALVKLWEEWVDRIVEWGGCPYHVGASYGRVLAPRWRGPYYSLMRTLKQTLDPNNIMNPGLFGNI